MLLSRNIFQTAIAAIQVKNPSHQPSISNLSFKMLEISAISSYIWKQKTKSVNSLLAAWLENGQADSYKLTAFKHKAAIVKFL